MADLVILGAVLIASYELRRTKAMREIASIRIIHES